MPAKRTEIRARVAEGAIDKITRMFPDCLVTVFSLCGIKNQLRPPF